MLASIDVTTGILDATWNPSGPLSPGSIDGVTALAVSGDTLYVGGSFTAFGGQPRTNAAAIDIPTGAVTGWAPTTDSGVASLAISPGGVFMGGNFTRVNGQPREDFAEVDAGGALTAWAADAYSSGVRALSVIGGTLVVGSHLGVSGGSARTDLAAFDLSADTLLPWAPTMSDTVVKLGAVGDTIFIGASRLAPATPPHLRSLVFAVHATSGAPVPWTPPPSAFGHVLTATHGSHVYVGGAFTAFTTGFGVRRLDPITGAADPSWFARLGGQNAITEGTIYSSGDGLNVVDLATGTPDSPWNPEFVPQFPIPATVNIKGMALDGRTLYVAVETIVTSNLSAQVFVFDRVSRARIQPMSPSSPTPPAAGNTIGAIAVADGQLIIANIFRTPGVATPLLAGSAVRAYGADGQAAAWNPGLSRNETLPGGWDPHVLVTPTDVIVLGYNAATSAPVQGIGVYARTPSVAPTSLRATTADNNVTLTWDAPSTPPANGYVVEVASETGSATPVSLLTGSQATSVNGVAGNGTYFARVRAANAPAGPASGPTNEIALVVGCSAPPTTPPLHLAAQVSGNTVNINWSAPPFTSASGYVLEAGSSAGASDLIPSLALPLSQTSIGGAVPAGTYFARLRASNGCGASPATSDVFFTVGATDAIPAPPTGLVVSVAGQTVSVEWNPSAGATGYILEGGTAPGLSNIARLALATTSVVAPGIPNGTYFLRVRAVNAAGLSAPSSEFVVIVPQ
jgi:hypothetical protein